MRLRGCVPVVVGAMLVVPGSGLADSGGGAIRIVRQASGFASTAQLSAGGASVRIGGPVRCTKGGRARIDVTLTQRASGALARGTWTGRCRGTGQHWTVRSAQAQTGTFDTGQATACAAAAAASSTRATDAVQFCRVVDLRR